MSASPRRPIVAGNWKMHTTPAEARELAAAVRDAIALEARERVEVVLCPPFVSLAGVREVLGGALGIGAQNMYWLERGAFTGEVSPTMLKELCDYVIIGHSERRQHFGETDDFVHQKLRAALAHQLVPIVCVGESLAQRTAGETQEWIALQVKGAIHTLGHAHLKGLVIAYEPIWAIGTGVAASGADANTVALGIRVVLEGIAGAEVAQAVRIQYGGSVTAANAAEFLGQPEIDGALVGGASLKAHEFAQIVQAAM